MSLKRIFFVLALVIAIGFVGSQAKADQTDSVTMTFASGASFNGTVTFSSVDNTLTGVNGVLSGYLDGTVGPGAGSDPITGVFAPGFNYSTDPNFSNFLMDAASLTSSALFNWIEFTYTFNGGVPSFADPSFAPDGNGNSVQYFGVDNSGSPATVSDPMVSGTISTPEPSSLLLLGAGLATLLGAASKKRRSSAAHCIRES
jgi:hypothetical protein